MVGVPREPVAWSAEPPRLCPWASGPLPHGGRPVQACRGPHTPHLGPDQAAALGAGACSPGPRSPTVGHQAVSVWATLYPAVPVTPSVGSVISPDPVRGRLGPGGSVGYLSRGPPPGEAPHPGGLLRLRWGLTFSPVEVAGSILGGLRGWEALPGGYHPLLGPGPFSPSRPAAQGLGRACHLPAGTPGSHP